MYVQRSALRRNPSSAAPSQCVTATTARPRWRLGLIYIRASHSGLGAHISSASGRPGVQSRDGESGTHPNSLGRQCAPRAHYPGLPLHHPTASSASGKPVLRRYRLAHTHAAQPPRARTGASSAASAPIPRAGRLKRPVRPPRHPGPSARTASSRHPHPCNRLKMRSDAQFSIPGAPLSEN
jgi:hypothetical protein